MRINGNLSQARDAGAAPLVMEAVGDAVREAVTGAFITTGGAAQVVTTFTGSAATAGLTSVQGFADASGIGLAARLTEYAADGTWHVSGNQDIDAILIGSRWAGANLTYSFPTDNSHYATPYYDPDYVSHQMPLNVAQQAAAVYAFGLIGGYTQLTFTQVSESDTVHGTIRISQTSSSHEASAEGNFPGSDASDGDIWFGQTNQPFYLTPQIGNWGQATFLHEIGHTMGLKHGHDDYTHYDLTHGNYIDGPGPFYGTAALPSDHDGQAWSVMTYRSDPGNAVMFEGDQFNQPQTYMQDDIAALQYLYGANFATHAEDSVYTFSETTGEMFINGVSQGDPDGSKVFRTVWDGNGSDTYDFSNFSGNESVDLRAGGWSTFNAAQLANNRAYSGGTVYAPGNIANALMYQGDTRSLIENALGGSGNDHMVGNQLDNHLSGNAGNDTLDGGLGNDTLDGGSGADGLTGGLGDDSYYVEDGGDTVTELAGEGTDSVYSTLNAYSLGLNVETLILLGTDGINGTGNSLANSLTGNSGNNILDGDAGADILAGGLGDDTYVVDNAGDSVIEASGAGNDTVQASVNAILAANVENLVLTGTLDLYGYGNELGNIITGNSGANALKGYDGNDILDGGGGGDSLAGGLGNDIYYVDNAGDSVTESAGQGMDTVYSSLAAYTLTANVESLVLQGSDSLNGTGNTLANSLTGNSGNNVLNGGTGADVMTGGLGNDTYVVDNAGDVVVEVTGEGSDSVLASVSYVLGANVENLTLTGSLDRSGYGNALDNLITGNTGNNSLKGYDGNDILDGGLGADTLAGGNGNDIYYVDNAGDVVTESLNQGTDTVYSAVAAYTLRTNVENLILLGSDNLNGTGNNLANSLTGNTGDNILDGGTGADTLAGGLGNDTYIADSAADVISENADSGVDTVMASFSCVLATNLENLVLTGTLGRSGYGNGLDNHITGNSGNNSLKGYAGNDTLDGAEGNDTLAGGLGADVFLFRAASGADTIADFVASQGDMININAYTQGNVDVSIFHQVGSDTVVDLGGGNRITVVNTLMNDVAGHVIW